MKSTKQVVILYYSKTGHVKEIANKIKKNFFSLGITGVEARLMDATTMDLDILKSYFLMNSLSLEAN